MYDNLLSRTEALARAYLSTTATRNVGARVSRADLSRALARALPVDPAPAIDIIEQLATAADPGIVATAGPRFFGFVTGGVHPAALAADWLVSAWDQNPSVYALSPAASIIEDVTASWILDALGLPAEASVGFTTGAQMANMTGLAAARHFVLRSVGWDVEARGLQGAPPVRIVVGAEAHSSIFASLRLLGFGTDTVRRVTADRHGRMRPEALADTLKRCEGPIIVCAQAGHVSTGAFDPFPEIASIVRAHGAWLHVDGAFGLWAAAAAARRHLVNGVSLADSWSTDGHKWLNVPYDCGMAICAHADAHRAAMSQFASYFHRGDEEERNGMDWVPESSRRARAIPVYAVLSALGRRGLDELIERCCALASQMAAALRREPGIEILNDVVLNQVLVRCGDRTSAVIARVQDEGVCWLGGTSWEGSDAMRISVSSWRTTAADIERSAESIVRAHRAVHGVS